jgi:DNA-binding XRE family transcriptional regulator
MSRYLGFLEAQQQKKSAASAELLQRYNSQDATSALFDLVQENQHSRIAYEERAIILSTARLVKEMRITANLTQRELAERTGLKQPNIARIESGEGKRGMTMLMAQRIASACGKKLIVGWVPNDTPATELDASTLNSRMLVL